MMQTAVKLGLAVSTRRRFDVNAGATCFWIESRLCSDAGRCLSSPRLSTSCRLSFSSEGLDTQTKKRFRSSTSATEMSKFRISDYDCVGFDLDHTLARYRLDNLFPMIYSTLCRFLVENRGYDSRLLEPLGDGHDFLLKGLLLDARRGNILKVGRNGAILRASHGTRVMSPAEIVSVYGTARQWQPVLTFRTTMCEGHGKLGKQMRSFKDFFDMPAALVAARMVDLIDCHKESGTTDGTHISSRSNSEEYDFWKDILDGLIDMYRSEAFGLGTGGYFPAVKEDTALYLQPCSDTTKRWLRDLKHAGKCTFLITGSAWDYASLLAEFCLGNDWRQYFDLVVTSARKPGFFTGRRPFLAAGCDDQSVVQLERGRMVAQGSYPELLTFMEGILGKDDPRVLYFGDNLIQDVFTPAKYSRCHAVAVLEEMEAEGMVLVGDADDIVKPHPACQYLTSSRWGSFFYDDDAAFGTGDCTVSGVARINTLWAEVLLTHSQLAVPSVEALARVPLDTPLTCFNVLDPAGSSGFFPSDPSILHSSGFNGS